MLRATPVLVNCIIARPVGLCESIRGQLVKMFIALEHQSRGLWSVSENAHTS